MVDQRGINWRKSSWCAHGECVEVAALETRHVAVRDNKNVSGPALIFAPAEWRSFLKDVKEGHPAAR
jgi:Domain of unknown function (DUF397)